MIRSEHHAFIAPRIATVDNSRRISDISLNSTSSEQSECDIAMSRTRLGGRGRTTGGAGWMAKAALFSVLFAVPGSMAQDKCISLSGSTTCGAFQPASISTTDDDLRKRFPFLQYVKDTASFDQQLSQYVRTTYVQEQYQNLLGCGNIDLVNTTDLYARFTTSKICNVIIQKSIEPCGLSDQASLPLCADSCTDFAESEAYLAADTNLCPGTSDRRQEQIRADFIDCSVPPRSLTPGSCIQGIANEPENCGYGGSTIGLCSYCASGGINSTDTCCYNSDIEARCANVVLPTITPTMTLPTASPSASSTATSVPEASSGNIGLSGGAIAGVVVGSVAGLALLIFLLLMCIRLARRRRGSQKGSIFNQPSPSRKGPQTAQIPANVVAPPQEYEVLPGGRIARMSALEGHTVDPSSRRGESKRGASAGAAAAAGAAAGYMTARRRGGDNHSSSDSFGDSPRSEPRAAILRPPPMNIRRHGSLSSSSVLAGEDPQSPTSAGGMSSPPGVNSQQSEQLPFFKDYYSQDDVHPGERVAVLWAYQPRAADEFALERGDMLKVVGIWDDGWATGVLLDERADEWEARKQAQRDSGVSHTSGRGRDTSPPASGEIKAFPLVCVCLPEHWRKTIEGDGSTETGSSAHHGGHLT
ncbi:hypothetical protein F4815DRAFT_446731 [Daldinia loculata]|nr:hypothetical protein F4815DRAFT_446731 [Daldinia loculata]